MTSPLTWQEEKQLAALLKKRDNFEQMRANKLDHAIDNALAIVDNSSYTAHDGTPLPVPPMGTLGHVRRVLLANPSGICEALYHYIVKAEGAE